MKRRALLFLMLFLATSKEATATEPDPWSFIVKEKGKWTLESNYLGGRRLLIFEGDEQKGELDIYQAIPKQEHRFIGRSTAGPKWSDFAAFYFIPLDGREHFCVCTWWDRRILIDLKQYKQLDDRPWRKELARYEEDLARSILRNAAANVGKSPSRERSIDCDLVELAAHLAGRRKIRDTADDLAKLEVLNGWSGSWGIGIYHDVRVDGKPFDMGPEESDVRTLVQLALRRLGKSPALASGLQFDGIEKGYLPKEPRRDQVSKLRREMDPPSVIKLLGQPDYFGRGPAPKPPQRDWDYVWRYDMEGQEPHSLLVAWDSVRGLQAVVKVTPPLWTVPQQLFADESEFCALEDGGVLLGALYSKSFRGQLVELKLAE